MNALTLLEDTQLLGNGLNSWYSRKEKKYEV